MTTMKTKSINVAKDWSLAPTGRYSQDGKSNGTDFRNKFIVNDLANFDEFFIDLDGTHGYGSSFLDEAFAGLVRNGAVSKADFFRIFRFKSDEDPSFIDEIKSYVDEVK